MDKALSARGVCLKGSNRLGLCAVRTAEAHKAASLQPPPAGLRAQPQLEGAQSLTGKELPLQQTDGNKLKALHTLEKDGVLSSCTMYEALRPSEQAQVSILGPGSYQ